MLSFTFLGLSYLSTQISVSFDSKLRQTGLIITNHMSQVYKGVKCK